MLHLFVPISWKRWFPICSLASALAWKNRITVAAFGAGNHRQGMPLLLASVPRRKRNRETLVASAVCWWSFNMKNPWLLQLFCLDAWWCNGTSIWMSTQVLGLQQSPGVGLINSCRNHPPFVKACNKCGESRISSWPLQTIPKLSYLGHWDHSILFNPGAHAIRWDDAVPWDPA